MIREFNLEMIRNHSMIVVVGNSNHTRSLTKKLVNHIAATDGIIINCKNDAFYEDFAIYNNITHEIVSKFYNANKSDKSIVVIDGLNNEINRDTAIKNFCFNGRCMKTSIVINAETDYLSLVARCNVDYAFLFPGQDNKKLYEQYAASFSDFSDFNEAVNNYCTDSTFCLVIHNHSLSKKLEDMCFWYRL